MSIKDLKRQIKGMEAVKERLENKVYGNQSKQQLNVRRIEKVRAKIAYLEDKLNKLEPKPVVNKKVSKKKSTKKKSSKKSTKRKSKKRKTRKKSTKKSSKKTKKKSSK